MNITTTIDLTERVKEARLALRRCQLCPRACKVNRTQGEKGYCSLGESAYCFRELLHGGEESELIPSHQLYFSGCNLRCEFCSVMEWNEIPNAATKLNIYSLKEIIRQREREGAKTLNLLGGEPVVNIAGILSLIDFTKPRNSVVWNSNMYYNQQVCDLLCGIVDIYLADFKCGNTLCAEKILDAEDYVHTIRRNLLYVYDKARVIVRHLILPGHYDCCLKPILQWISQEIPMVEVSLRGDYVPPAGPLKAPCKYLQFDELQQAKDLAIDLGIRLIQ